MHNYLIILWKIFHNERVKPKNKTLQFVIYIFVMKDLKMQIIENRKL